MYTRSYRHNSIKKIFPNIFFVTGVNQYIDDSGEQQHSRNMVIVRENDKLSLINTVRLTEEGLAELNSLGNVENIIRIGAFHGRDDAFYVEQYHAKLWAIPGMKHENNLITDVELISNGPKPFADCSIFIFQSSKEPEGILHVNRENGIIITCDSIKNWLEADEFFSLKTAAVYEKAGFFGKATVSKIWREHCQVDVSDFMKLDQFNFRHMLSAHGEPLLNIDKYCLLENIQHQYGQNNKYNNLLAYDRECD